MQVAARTTLGQASIRFEASLDELLVFRVQRGLIAVAGGQPAWEIRLGGGPLQPPLLTCGQHLIAPVYVPRKDSRIVAVDRQGEVAWRVDIPGAVRHLRPTAVQSGTELWVLYVGAGTFLRALDLASGECLREQRVPAVDEIVRLDNRVVILGRDGVFEVVDRNFELRQLGNDGWATHGSLTERGLAYVAQDDAGDAILVWDPDLEECQARIPLGDRRRACDPTILPNGSILTRHAGGLTVEKLDGTTTWSILQDYTVRAPSIQGPWLYTSAHAKDFSHEDVLKIRWLTGEVEQSIRNAPLTGINSVAILPSGQMVTSGLSETCLYQLD